MAHFIFTTTTTCNNNTTTTNNNNNDNNNNDNNNNNNIGINCEWLVRFQKIKHKSLRWPVCFND